MKKVIAALAVVGCLIGIFSCDSSEESGSALPLAERENAPERIGASHDERGFHQKRERSHRKLG